MEIDPIELLQAFLCSDDLEPGIFCRSIIECQTKLQGRDRVLSHTLLRLGYALATFIQLNKSGDGSQGVADIVVLLRQIIRASHPLNVSSRLWNLIRGRAEASGLFGVSNDQASVQVMARAWTSNWLANSEPIDVLEQRRDDEASPGDGMVSGISQVAGLNWTTYQSGAQKAAVDCWVFAAPGSTTLVTLPTGGGKSLCTLLPPWFETRGGQRSRGTTLVVVPTVALALDQERQARRFFQQSLGDFSRPICWTGDTPPEERTAIQAALREGRLPIIFTSPESLLVSRLYDVCLDAARNGLITRFVMDEAHLIQSWGAGFRPEFQLLAAYRRKLWAASNGQLRTLLLSATVAGGSRTTIEQLFAEPGKLVVIQANRLRPEIGYWFDYSHSGMTRREHVTEALRYLPRPLILYVTRPEQAKQWESELHSQGYVRIASFTGETDANQRRQLVKAWSENQIDIMVATSAFGLGVDKSDVRAVLHATLPENIDRFYQEVGRGGRDGYSSISLVCATTDGDDSLNDLKLAYALQPRLITFDRALLRWKGLIQSAVVEDGVRWVDRDTTPIGRDDMPHSERNREWNDHLLLLMCRAKLIDIIDAPPPRETIDGEVLARLPIKILDPEVFNDPAHALRQIEPFREDEKQNAQRALRGIVNLVQEYAEGKEEDCLASQFAGIYDDVQYACGGCPACRKGGQLPYSDTLRFSIDYPIPLRRSVVTKDTVDVTLRAKMNAWRTLNVTWTGPRLLTSMNDWCELVSELVKIGFQQVIYPFELLDDQALRDKLIQTLAKPDPQRLPLFHRLVPDYWIKEEGYPLFPLATIVLYPPTDRDGDGLFKAIQRLYQQGIVFPGLINIIHESLFLASEGKKFTEHVDGLNEPITWLHDYLNGSQKSVEFF